MFAPTATGQAFQLTLISYGTNRARLIATPEGVGVSAGGKAFNAVLSAKLAAKAAGGRPRNLHWNGAAWELQADADALEAWCEASSFSIARRL